MALVGVDGHLVEVEADLGVGVPSYSLVGLPDASLAESRDRVRAAMVNSGQHWPATKRVTVNLSPASLPKRGSSFDLCIAAAVLAAQEVVPPHVFDDAVLLGELAWTAGCGRCAACCPRSRRRRGPGWRPRWCRRPTRPRRRWCPACG